MEERAQYCSAEHGTGLVTGCRLKNEARLAPWMDRAEPPVRKLSGGRLVAPIALLSSCPQKLESAQTEWLSTNGRNSMSICLSISICPGSQFKPRLSRVSCSGLLPSSFSFTARGSGFLIMNQNLLFPCGLSISMHSFALNPIRSYMSTFCSLCVWRVIGALSSSAW